MDYPIASCEIYCSYKCTVTFFVGKFYFTIVNTCYQGCSIDCLTSALPLPALMAPATAFDSFPATTW
jgi:hypothetical protein